jgi:hypothetical protein
MFYWLSRQGEVQGDPNASNGWENGMDFTVWDVLIGIISWSIRLLFWPLGFVIKYREFFGTVLPYLFLGVIALIVGTAALGLLGTVLRALFVCVRGICRFFAAFFDAFRSSRKEEPQEDETTNAEPAEDPNDPYHILGISRNATKDELNARYRQLLRVNHPDKVAQLDPEIQAFATERSRRIIEAYEAVLVPAKS